MTSTIAEVILALSIPLMIGVFFVLPPLPATLVVALGADMFLPVGCNFRLPFCPPFGKGNLPYLCILVGCLLRCPARVTKLPKEKWFVTVSVITILGSLLTAYTNTDALAVGSVGRVVIRGMTFTDGMFLGIHEYFPSCVAFYLGYMIFRGSQDAERLLAGLGIAGLIYCPFAIFEMRMSPQLHYWIYGYGIGAFNQTIRWGGYRPSVFMTHGLALARFFMTTTLALFVLSKCRRRLLGMPVRLLAWFQLVILVLCRSTGSVVLVLVGVLAVLLTKPKRQLLLASVLALLFFAYPFLRLSGFFPIADVLDAAGSLQEDRSESLAFRFRNEDILLEHASERILFGWGAMDRSIVYDTNGEPYATTDGWWIIIFGLGGVQGFAVTFIPLLWPVLWARRRLRKYDPKGNQHALAGLALILALWTFDLIPNGLWSCYSYLMAGVLTRGLRELASMGTQRSERSYANSTQHPQIIDAAR